VSVRRNLPERVRASLPPLDALKEQVSGDPDLELVVQRLEQMELFLEGMAELKAAKGEAEHAAAEKKLIANRQGLRGPLPEG